MTSSLQLTGTATALFAVAVLGGLLPQQPKSSSWSVWATLFAAGVVCSVSYTHLLPDAVQDCGLWGALMWYTVGIILVGGLDKALTSYLGDGADHAHGTTDETRLPKQELAVAREGSPLLADLKRQTSYLTAASSGSCSSCSLESDVEAAANGSSDVEEEQRQQPRPNLHQSQSDDHHTTTISPTAWSVWVSLCLHSFLEGASLGSTNDLTLACGVLLHKGLVSAAVSSTVWHSHGGLVLSFAAMTPLGMWAGVQLTHDLDGPAAGVVAALAGGTFLYVGIAELLIPAWKQANSDSHKNNIGQSLGMVVLGMGLVVLFGG